MIKLNDVFMAINDTLLATFDDIRAYKERINRQKRPDMSVELINFTTRPHSRYMINKALDLDIIYFSKSNTVGEALIVADKLMGAFSMGLTVRAYGKDKKIVEKRHLHCLKPPEYKLVDQDLHFLIKFDFADELEPYYLADDKAMKGYNPAYEPGKIDRYRPGDRGRENPNYKARNADLRDFAEDVGFESEEAKRAYEEEKIKLMNSLKLDYEFMEV